MSKFLSLKHILVGFITVIVISTLLIFSVVTFTIFSATMTEKIALSRIDVLSQISERIISLKETTTLLSNVYYYKHPLFDYDYNAEFNASDSRKILEGFNELDILTGDIIQTEKVDFSYIFILENGFYYNSDDSIEDFTIKSLETELWLDSIYKAKGEIVWVSTHKLADEYKFSMGRSIIDPMTHESIGIFLFNISESNLSNTYRNLIHNNEIYIVDQEGSIVSHSNKRMLGINFYDMDEFEKMFNQQSYQEINKNSKEYLFSKYNIEPYNWIIVEEIPMSEILKPLEDIKKTIVILAVSIMIISSIIIYFIAGRTTKPLSNLCKQLELVAEGDTKDLVFDVGGWQEIGKICEECNYMNNRINLLVSDIKSKESAKRKAEMGFLQAQMNPHFLYNTLFSVKCMIDMDKEKAKKIVDALTAILKYILSYKEEEVYIFEEIDFINEYASLQKIRFGDSFDLEIKCDESLMSHKILRMILQPILENAIIHATSGSENQTNIVIKFEDKTKAVQVTISDDGVGISQDKKESMWLKDKKSQSNMIGIKNVKDRIKLIYGEEGSLHVHSEVNKGTDVMIRFPKEIN